MMKRRHAAMVMSAAAALVLVGSGCGGEKPKTPAKVTRFGWVIGLKDEKIDYYKELHAACWPGVLKMIGDCNIRNYSIYMHRMDNGKHYLFSYLEYVGDDFDADMKRMAADETTQRWWKETDPCQFPVKYRGEDEKSWATMEEVFHCD